MNQLNQRVEFFGPPGTGKSTVLNRLVRKAGELSFVTPQEANVYPRYGMEFIDQVYFKYPSSRRILRKVFYKVVSSVDLMKRQHSFSSEYNEYLRVLLELVYTNNCEDILLKIKSLQWTLQVLDNYLSLNEELLQKEDVVVIFEEGMIQKTIGVLRDSSQAGALVDMMERIPLPKAAVYFEGSTDVLKRIRSRQESVQRVTLRHLVMSDAEILKDLLRFSNMSANVYSVLESKRVPTLVLAYEDSLNVKVKKVEDFARRVF